MYSKETIYNLALGALLLQRQVISATTDQSNEVKVLNTYWDIAYRATLEDMDLDSTSTEVLLTLVAMDPNLALSLKDQTGNIWKYAYQYPTNCAFFRRIKTQVVMDNKRTHEPKKVMMLKQQKVILCNKQYAVAEIIPYDLPIGTLSATAGIVIAHRLAMLAAPLITGKGAQKLILEIEKKYTIYKAEAQAQDERENFSFQEDCVLSEFVDERLS